MDTGRTGAPAVVPDLRREDDLERAYLAHGHEIRRFAAYRLGDDAVAADVVQEVFVRAWRSAERYDPQRASVRGWLFAIARNVVIDHLRRLRSRPDERGATAPDALTELVDAGQGAGPFDDALTTSWMLREALDRIGPQQRRAIVETHVRGRPHDVVAAEEGIPVGTLRSRVHYGLRNLRTVLDEMGVSR